MKNILKISVILGVCFASGMALSHGFYYTTSGCGYGYNCAAKVFVPVGTYPTTCGSRVFNDCYTRVSNIGARVWIPGHYNCRGFFVPGHWRGNFYY